MRIHHKQFSSTTNAKLQEYMQRIIKQGTVNAGALEAVNSSMARVWKEARQHLPVPQELLDRVVEQVEQH